MGAICCCISEPVDYTSEVNLFHFDLHRAVGKGAFGKVRVVEHKPTKQLYALKYIDKARCIKQKAVSNIIQERRLLEEIDHPFIVNLRFAFQDDENCFFVLDLMLGGDLRFHMERRANLAENVVLFWTAEIASGLEYLHRQRIIHRDIKPDNILLDARGHAHITDFNVAIHYSERRMHSSVAGSMAYMAPEVIGRKGYTWCIDYWSLGITAYELLFKTRPFEGRTVEKMTSSICKEPLKFPEDADEKCSPEGIHALRSFLDRKTAARLGCRSGGQGFVDLQTHPWFRNIDWDNLETKEAQPPFVPDLKRGNYDPTHELDEFLMVEKPLTHSKRKQNPDLDKMKPELRELEEQFTVYDFMKNSRVSYYPHNLPVGCRTLEETKSLDIEGNWVMPSQTESLVPTATVGERSLAGSPAPDGPPSEAPPLPTAYPRSSAPI